MSGKVSAEDLGRGMRWLPTAILMLVVVAMLVHGPIAQLERYHEFADTRTFLGLPNAADVLSNAGFVIVGLWGLWALRDKRRHPRLAAAWPAYLVFLVAVALTAAGSSYYHLAPDNGRLLWDRLPIALACAGLLAGVYADTHPSLSRWLLPALVVAAIASVLWWSATGDLRLYLLIQGAPLIIIPLWQWMHAAPRADRVAFGIAILLYALAKVFELNDGAVLDATGFVSGHTVKHLLALLAAAVLTASLVRRVRDPRP